MSSPIINGQLSYGDKLTDEMIQSVSGGKWELTYGDLVLDFVGAQEVSFTFVPDNLNNYDKVTLTKIVNVKKRVVDIVLEDKEVPYTGEELKLTASVSGLVFGDDESKYELILSGGSGINVGNYIGTYSLKSDYYEAVSKNATLKIIKANPTYEIPILNGYYNQKLIDIELPECFSWYNPNDLLDEVGIHSFNAKYTPKDTNNYNIIENVELTINVDKAESIINSSDNYLFVVGEDYDIDANLNHNESQINYDTSNLKVGLNKVVLTVEASSHYKEVSKEINVYLINKLEKIEVTYSEDLYLSKLELPTYEFGKFSFSEDRKLKFGLNQSAKVIFSLNDTDLNREFTLNFDVKKKQIEIEIIKDTFIYNGEPQKLEYKVPYEVNVIESDISLTNVGSIEYSLVIKDENYEGSKSGTLTSNECSEPS